jgi:hypothetical protein
MHVLADTSGAAEITRVYLWIRSRGFLRRGTEGQRGKQKSTKVDLKD